MLQKFGKRVMNNFGLKILAVLFAVVLWIVVVNIDDPSNSKPYTTSVSLENKSYITSMGKWADYLDGKNTITFSVYAKRSVHNTLTNANFTATADAQKIEYDEIEKFQGLYFPCGQVSSNQLSAFFVCQVLIFVILTAVLRSQSGERCEIFFSALCAVGFDIEPSGDISRFSSFEKAKSVCGRFDSEYL